MVLTLKLHSGYEARLRLVSSKRRVEKFRGWGNYELVVKCDGSGSGSQYTLRELLKP
jgi:transcription initiation factor IIF auxiliary subunit